jgi:uncharacterized protein
MNAPAFRRSGLMIAVLAAVLAAACDHSAKPGLPTVAMAVGSARFNLEIARTEDQREIGLMRRDNMPADHGMIFVFDGEEPREFWMKDTRFDLDIIFLDATGRVVSVKQMYKYDLSTTPSDGPAKYAIELNLGSARAAGVKAGDRLLIPAEAHDP